MLLPAITLWYAMHVNYKKSLCCCWWGCLCNALIKNLKQKKCSYTPKMKEMSLYDMLHMRAWRSHCNVMERWRGAASIGAHDDISVLRSREMLLTAATTTTWWWWWKYSDDYKLQFMHGLRRKLCEKWEKMFWYTLLHIRFVERKVKCVLCNLVKRCGICHRFTLCFYIVFLYVVDNMHQT